MALLASAHGTSSGTRASSSVSATLGGNGMVVGFSDKGSVVPLSITRNDRSKGLACDHTLPPMYYLPWWGGEIRKAANLRVRELLFSGSERAPR
jgi:hypothetical protein